jgi:urea transport system ATP-binding protein
VADVALQVDGLSVDFSGFKVVDNFTMNVMDGELRVLLGPNGAGKTTLLDLISGKTRSTGGRVFLYDKDITNWDERRVALAGVGRKFQIPSVFRDLSVRRNLEVAAIDSRSVFANLAFGIGDKARDRVDEILTLIGLADRADQTAANLSHGQVQWLELGILMTQDPRVLLLDEPTAGMTQAETRRTAEIINGLKGRHTVVVVEHDMAFVRMIATTITVMHLGKILAEGDITAIENNAQVREAYLGPQGIA